MQKFKVFFTASLFLSVALVSCTSSKKMFEQNTNHWVPADFKPQSDVLLIEKVSDPSIEKDVESYIKGTYPYKCEFISTEDLKDKLKNNSLGYNFVLRHEIVVVEPSSSTDVHSIDHKGSAGTLYYFYNVTKHKKCAEPAIDAGAPSWVIKKMVDRMVILFKNNQ